MNSKAESPRAPLLARLGVAVSSTPPVGTVRDGWPALTYQVSLTRAGSLVWSGQFHLGLGYVRIREFRDSTRARGLRPPQDFDALLWAWKRDPSATFKDKKLWVKAAAWLAQKQGVAPDVECVLSNLLSNGEAHLQSYSFEQWARDLGCDPDSRKAEAIFNACIEEGRALARAFTPAELTELREAFADY